MELYSSQSHSLSSSPSPALSDVTASSSHASGNGIANPSKDGTISTLTAENLDLKLRLYYLEEKNRNASPLAHQLHSALITQAQQSTRIHELEVELDEKATMLLKAREAIERMTEEAEQREAAMNDRVAAAVQEMQRELMAAREATVTAQAQQAEVENEMKQLRSVLHENERLRAIDAQELAVREQQNRELTATHSALEQQLSAWRDEISARENMYSQTQQQLQHALEEIETLKQSQGALNEAHAQIQAMEAHVETIKEEAHRQIDAHTQQLNESHAEALLEMQSRHDDELRQKLAEVDERHAAELARLNASHEDAIRTLESRLASREAEYTSNIARLEEELNVVREEASKDARQMEKVVDARTAQMEERVAQTKIEAARQLEETKSNQDATVRQLEQQLAEGQAESERRLKEASDHHMEEIERFRQFALQPLRQQLDNLEADLATAYIPRKQYEELSGREATLKEELRTTKSKLQQVGEELDKIRTETVSVARLEEAEDARERLAKEVNVLQQQLMGSSGQIGNNYPGVTLGSHHAPSLSIPATTPTDTLTIASTSTSSPSPAHARTLSTLSSASFATSSISPLPPNGAHELKQSLRKLQSENRSLSSQLTIMRRRLEQEREEREQECVDKRALEEAHDELEEMHRTIERRDQQVRLMRDALVQLKINGGVELQDVDGDGKSGFDLRMLSPAASGRSGAAAASPSPMSPRLSPDASISASPSILSPTTSPSLSASREQLLSEVSRLQRALQSRSTDLATCQQRLKEQKMHNEKLQEQMVAREREALVEAESVIASLQREVQQYEQTTNALRNQVAELSRALQTSEQQASDTRIQSATLSEQLAQHRQQHEASIQEVQKRLDDAQTEKQQLEEALHELTQQLEQMQESMRFDADEHPPPVAFSPADHTTATTNGAPTTPIHHTRSTPASTAARPSTRDLRRPQTLSPIHPLRPSPNMSTQQRSSPFQVQLNHTTATTTALFSPMQQQRFNASTAPATHTSALPSVVSTLMHELYSTLDSYRSRLIEYEYSYSSLQAYLSSTLASHARSQQEHEDAYSKLLSELDALQVESQQKVHSVREEAFDAQRRHEEELTRQQSEWKLKAREMDQEKNAIQKELDRAHLEAQSKEKEIAELKSELTSVKQRQDASNATLEANEATRHKLAEKVDKYRALLRAAPTNDALRSLQDRIVELESNNSRLEVSLQSAEAASKDAETDRVALLALRLAHSTLESRLQEVEVSLSAAQEEVRVLNVQLEASKSYEAEAQMLQQRVQQAERRAEVVGADQQHHVQVARRVLLELCEVMHQAKIPHSNYMDASSARPPSFLVGGTFHFPDDAEQAVKWIKSKAHELQRIRRAFEFTLLEVEERWKTNFAKMQTLLEQRGRELSILQRRLLVALGQKETITGNISWR